MRTARLSALRWACWCGLSLGLFDHRASWRCDGRTSARQSPRPTGAVSVGRSSPQLSQAELDVLQIPVALLRRLDQAHDPLKASEPVVKDDLDRLHTLGGTPRDRTTTTHKLGKFRAQPRLQAVQEPYGEDAAFAWREAQPQVRPDDELDATADHRAIAAGMRRARAPPDQRAIRWRGTRVRRKSKTGCRQRRWRRSIAVHDLFLSRALLSAHVGSTALAVLLAHDATRLTYRVGQVPGSRPDTFWTRRT